MIEAARPAQALRRRRGGARREPSRAATGASPDCSAPTAPASPPRCACSTRCSSPTRGDALIDGISAVHEPARGARARLGRAAARRRHLPEPHRAREHPLLRRAARACRARRCERAPPSCIELLEMEEFADRRAKGFSQGQRIKTALARALVHGPRNLMLDEPTNGLDVMAVRSAARAAAPPARRRALRAVLQPRDAGGRRAVRRGRRHRRTARWSPRGTPEEIRARTGTRQLEDAFVQLIGDGERRRPDARHPRPCSPRSSARTCATGARCSRR